MSDQQQGPGWWLASDGKWYPPASTPSPPVYQQAPDVVVKVKQQPNGCAVGCGSVLLVIIVLLVIGALSGSGDDDAAQSDPLSPQCIEVTTDLDLPAVAATEAPPDAFNGHARWYYASRTGGLWVSDRDPTDAGTGSASILPLNARARRQSIYGVDVGPDAPAFSGASADDGQAQHALECAQS